MWVMENEEGRLGMEVEGSGEEVEEETHGKGKAEEREVLVRRHTMEVRKLTGMEKERSVERAGCEGRPK